ncbi:uncharacterized protein [Parasteatoda tepidariorum]|uniref:uncharacterized protein n=1 Tax=Parasteatoda tepidariorum TaxID=114398 RepID=UPI00077FA6A3|nr:uncharacterized protein LOC107453096 [Parasteatoda tepidariorum]
MDRRYLGMNFDRILVQTANIPAAGRLNYQYTQEDSYRDNFRGVSNQVQRKIKMSAGKYKVQESRKHTVGPSRMNSGIKTSIKQVQSKKKLTIDLPKEKKKPKVMKSIDNTSDKVKMEIFLEKGKTGVFITKVKVGSRVRWQNVREEKRALRYHPAVRKWQTVMTAVATMKNHKTLHISLTKDESKRYKTGDLLEETKAKPQPKPGMANQQIIYYQVNNSVCNAGPSTLAHCVEDSHEIYKLI